MNAPKTGSLGYDKMNRSQLIHVLSRFSKHPERIPEKEAFIRRWREAKRDE
jgi:hypothetical protein